MLKRIVQVVTQMEAGGAQSVALLLHRELIARGIDAELWFLYVKTPAWPAEHGVRSIWPRRPAGTELPRMLWALFQQMRRFRPHVVIAHTHYASAIALPLARACSVPQRLAVHHNAIGTYPWLARQMESCCKRLGICTESIAVSEEVRHSLLKWDAKRYRVSTRCVYNGLARPVGHRTSTAVHPGGRLEGSRILFSVGRLAEQKNQMALIETLPDLPECIAVIAGRGPLEPALQRRAVELGVSSQLLLLGEIEPTAVAGWMHRADVFVFPSRFEAMPMALLEAMREGMMIVASDIAAHREVAGSTALLTATDPLSLTRSIRAALTLRDSGNAMGRMARERSLRFTVDAMADGYLESM